MASVQKFEVPYNADPAILSVVETFRDHVAMMYGRADDGYPNGRNTKGRPPVTLDEITRAADACNRMEIPFNYVLNGGLHNNREFDRAYRKTFTEKVREIKNRGIPIVTLGNLFLIEVIKQEVPDIEIFASVMLEADCLARMKQIDDLGVDYYCLSKTTLKNFALLKSAAQVIRATPVLLVNEPCLHHCAYTQYHNNILSLHTSSDVPYENYCRLHCVRDFARDRRKIVSASFVRPEDLCHYSAIGFSTFKLCDRKQTTPWIERVLTAYVDEWYDGNLSDIMAPWSPLDGPYGFPERITEEGLEKNGISKEQIRFSPNLDNRKLDGYLDFWLYREVNGCADKDCESCLYCDSVVDNALTSDGREEIIISNIDHILKKIQVAS